MPESPKRRAVERIAGALWRDCRTACRSLRGSPSFTATALVLLAFGIGLNTTVFSVMNAVLFRPLAVAAPHELAFVSRTDGTGNERNLGAYKDVQNFADGELFTGGAGVELDTAILRIGSDVEVTNGERVSANYFEVLGVAPNLGRTLVASLDGATGAERVVVISDALWRRRFQADRAVIGRQVALGTPMFISETAPRYTIVGVVGPEFTGVSNAWTPTDYWVEFKARESDVFGVMQTRTITIGMVIARMRPGVTLDRVRAFAETTLPTSDVWVRPDSAERGPRGLVVSSSPPEKLPFGGGTIVPRRLGVGLLLVAGLVLAIGAANLAGLLGTRGHARRREVAIRLSLGATRGQIARQLVTETVLLALGGGFFGVALSRALVLALLSDMGNGFGGAYARLASLGVPVDGRVIGFTALTCVATGLAVGLASASRMRKATALTVVGSEISDVPSARRLRRGHLIVVPQLASSLALVIVALVAARALLKVALMPMGYEPARAAYVTFEKLFHTGYSAMSSEQKSAYLTRVATFPRRLIGFAEAVPGIEAAAIASSLPITPRRADVVTRQGPSAGRALSTETAWVTSEYFHVMGIPVVQGRVFDDAEVAHGNAVAVVDERLANRLWPGMSALGKSLSAYIGGVLSTQRWYEVVGVVGAIRGPLSEGESYSFAYLPWPRDPTPELILVGRGRTAGTQLLASLRDVAREADANVGVLQAGMLSGLIDQRRYPRRLAAALLACCALGGLLLAVTGFYGVQSYAVAQRRRELGIRAALGARPRDLVRLVVGEGVIVAAIGSMIGIPLGLTAMRIASHYVLPIPAVDVLSLFIALIAVSVIALAACYFPARRAGNVDPIVVLRTL